ncbi:AraC family transcriptional regulator [Arthrobacter sp. AET 35A]|nr:AraC family transcriptional regulator [Arthrobacter sp. AET 35A]
MECKLPATCTPGSAQHNPTDRSFTRYTVPASHSPEDRFEHWRTWFGSAVVAPIRLEKTEAVLRSGFNPSAVSLDGPGFSLVELNNEPANVYWKRDFSSEDLRFVHFRGPSLTLNFHGRSEAVTPGTVRFLDLSSDGSFLASAGMLTSHINIDRVQLGLDGKSMKRLLEVPDLRENPLVQALVIPALNNWHRSELDLEASRLQPVYRSMMTAVTSSLLEVPADNDDLKLARLLNIKGHIRRNCHHTDFGVDAVVDYSLLSRRSLYSLFCDEDLSVNGYIRAFRTLNALDHLSDMNSRIHSLRNIAQVSGFPNLQAMRRAFDDLTGCSLGDARDDPEARQAAAAALRAITRMSG